MKKNFVVTLLVILLLCLTACGTEPVENAVIPMNSVTEQINEAGIHAYASSLKTHYRDSSKDGDLGSYQFTLLTESTPMFFQAPWWVDCYNERLTADIVVIAGQTGTSYTGTIECYKCGYSEDLDEVVGETTISRTFTCTCDDNNPYWGMKKKLTVTVIPLP